MLARDSGIGLVRLLFLRRSNGATSAGPRNPQARGHQGCWCVEEHFLHGLARKRRKEEDVIFQQEEDDVGNKKIARIELVFMEQFSHYMSSLELMSHGIVFFSNNKTASVAL